KFVANALSPAKVVSVQVIDEAGRAARVVVPDFQLSLAIGKEGQNARLAARLTGWRIDIKSETQVADDARGTAAPAVEVEVEPAPEAVAEVAAAEELVADEAVEEIAAQEVAVAAIDEAV